MKKVMILIPCLMLENNRQANHISMEYAKENYPVDKIVIYDQEFIEEDYKEGFEYIGYAKKREGFVKPRNELLKYFYNSDFDFAIWLDANEKVGKACLNDFLTLIDGIKKGTLDLDVILQTLGITISQERIFAKKRRDFKNVVYCIKMKKGYEWMHGMIMSNFKKKYGEEVYIDERCDPRKGTSEDIYFVNLLRSLFSVYLCPTVSIFKPSNTTSTWMNEKKSYDYPDIDYPKIDEYISENYRKTGKRIGKFYNEKIVKLERVEPFKECIKEYKPRRRKK